MPQLHLPDSPESCLTGRYGNDSFCAAFFLDCSGRRSYRCASEASPNGHGWPMGLLQAAVISLPGFALLWLNSRSRRETSPAA